MTSFFESDHLMAEPASQEGRRNPDPLCVLCDRRMRLAVPPDGLWRFYRCCRCGYWTSRAANGNWPYCDYSDAPDYTSSIKDWGVITDDVTVVLKHKFQLLHKEGPNGLMVDVGCSEGAYVEAARQLGWRAVGFEVDHAKLQRARLKGLDCRGVEQLAECGVSLRADVVMLRHVVEHIPDFVSTLKSAAAGVAPGGVLWVEVPNQLFYRLFGLTRRVKGGRYLGALYPPSHIHAFEPNAVWRLGDLIGLRCERLVSYAPADKRWMPRYLWTGRRLKAVAHQILAGIGCGESMAAVYRKAGNPQGLC